MVRPSLCRDPGCRPGPAARGNIHSYGYSPIHAELHTGKHWYSCVKMLCGHFLSRTSLRHPDLGDSALSPIRHRNRDRNRDRASAVRISTSIPIPISISRAHLGIPSLSADSPSCVPTSGILILLGREKESGEERDHPSPPRTGFTASLGGRIQYRNVTDQRT